MIDSSSLWTCRKNLLVRLLVLTCGCSAAPPRGQKLQVTLPACPLPVRILNGGPGHHLWSQRPNRQCWRPLVQPLSRHLTCMVHLNVSSQSLSDYEPSQHTESEIYIRVTSSCSDVMLRSGAPHQAPFLELGRLSSNFCVWKQHGRHREVAAQSVSASPASEWNDSTTGRHKVSNHVSASTQQLVD